ncbi:specifically androgen-regulated gene protein [Kryptolebias marmoratus]|uniref:Zgc:158258 n=1 Tax=Kryptolebias marmoratus TaxID=37003 RepID=A0A3Q3B2H3_KRYMA|nr:specifically androgen-regulated gene protein [Kryptolebias marmoratus]
MPKNDAWPGDSGLETMDGLDSAGSCDSVVSANSGFSDDSLDHLSAEEKACLMFLEETIESLDTEEDSGPSNDEPDQLPSSGNLATKLADLSAFMSKNKLKGLEKCASKESNQRNADIEHIQSYLVPTPFVVAHQNPNPPPVPLEVKVVVPPSTKPRENSGKTAEGPLPRGPLSYDALVHLRRNASTKKTPLCPTVDHTIDLNKHCSAPVEDPNHRNLPRSVKFNLEVHKSKTEPPVVAPKPKKIPVDIAMKLQNEGIITQDISDSVNHATNPQVVRLEALQKLGLLKDQEPQSGKVAPPLPPKPHFSLDPVDSRSRSHCNPARNLSFTSSQATTKHKHRNLHNSVNSHQPCRNNQESVSASNPPPQSSKLKSPGLEPSVSPDYHRNTADYTEPQPKTSDKPSNVVGYTVMVVPGMGSDRKEALRKLGLLKK